MAANSGVGARLLTAHCNCRGTCIGPDGRTLWKSFKICRLHSQIMQENFYVVVAAVVVFPSVRTSGVDGSECVRSMLPLTMQLIKTAADTLICIPPFQKRASDAAMLQHPKVCSIYPFNFMNLGIVYSRMVP